MADIINLNKARKARDKAIKETQAEQNRVVYGRKKSEKTASKDDARKQSLKLDDHKLDGSD